MASTPTAGIFSATGTITLGTDANGIATETLPVIVAASPTAGQALVGDDAIVKAHDQIYCYVYDSNLPVGNQVIDELQPLQIGVYQAGPDLQWHKTQGRIVVGHNATAPTNTATPVGWLEACTTNGQTIGRVPIYQ